MSFLSDAIVLGLFEAAPLILAAAGFTLIYYLSGFINVAYAENLTFGAYFAVLMNTAWGLGFYLSIIPAALLTGCLSVITYLVLYRPSIRRGVGPTEMIILSVGLSFFLRYGSRLFFGSRLYQFNTAEPAYLTILGVGVTGIQLVALALVAVTAIALYLFIYHTNYGEMMRALASNEDLARVSGINPTKVSILIWFIAGVASGLAGVFFGVFSFVNYLLGWRQILIIIMITIVGGIGNVRGALITGIAAGIVVAGMTLVTEPLYGQVIILAFFIVILKYKKVRS
jgi:branched-subunit amino acid ABC-type transport system permease component